jgi:hypothetical protein
MVANQGINSPHAEATNFRAQEVGTSTSLTDPLLVPFPSSLQDPRCYTNASTQPDQSIAVPRDAGIGIFIVDTQVQPPHSIFIKAAMKSSSSVIMAAAAALALAAEVVSALQMHQVTVLSDNKQLV